MNGEILMERLLYCDEAMERLPLELQVTLPLPGIADRTVECWYYRLDCGGSDVKLYSPARHAVWNADTMTILCMEAMEPALLGSGADVLTPAHRQREDAYLNGPLTAFLGQDTRDGVAESWLGAAPEALRAWLRDAIKEEYDV